MVRKNDSTAVVDTTIIDADRIVAIELSGPGKKEGGADLMLDVREVGSRYETRFDLGLDVS